MKHSEGSGSESSSDVRSGGQSKALTVAHLSRWIAPAGLVIGVAALILTLVQWLHSGPDGIGSRSFSDQQIKDARTSVCAAYTTVHRAVGRNTHLENPPDGGAIGPLAVATSARLALYGGGGYLRDQLVRAPAAPDDLTKAVGSLATTLEDLAINYLAGAPAFIQDQLRHNLDEQLIAVDKLCK